MDIERNDLIAIILGFIFAGIVAVLVVHTQPSHSKTDVHSSAPAVEENSTSTLLVTTTIKPVASTIPAKPVKRAVQSTTTSEVPLPLTPEQEAHIPDAGHETDPDFNEHMPADYPYEDRDYEASPQ